MNLRLGKKIFNIRIVYFFGKLLLADELLLKMEASWLQQFRTAARLYAYTYNLSKG